MKSRDNNNRVSPLKTLLAVSGVTLGFFAAIFLLLVLAAASSSPDPEYGSLQAWRIYSTCGFMLLTALLLILRSREPKKFKSSTAVVGLLALVQFVSLWLF